MPRTKKIEAPVITTTKAQTADAVRIKRLIAGVSASYIGSRDKVHEAAMAIMRHAAPVDDGGKGYGDCTLALPLCMAVPARERNSLVGWFALYGRIGLDLANNKVRLIREQSAAIQKRGYIWDLSAADKNPWHTDPAKANPAPAPLNTYGDFFASMTKLIDKLMSDARKTLDPRLLRKGETAKFKTEDDAKHVLATAPKIKAMVLDYKMSETAAQSAMTAAGKPQGEAPKARRGRPPREAAKMAEAA